MSNVTASRADNRQEGVLIDVKLAATTKLYGGTIAHFNSSGLAVAGGDTSGNVLAGVVEKTADSNGTDTYVKVWREGVFDFDCSGADQTWVGQNCTTVDNHTVALAATTTNDVVVGRVVGFNSATSVRVKL